MTSFVACEPARCPPRAQKHTTSTSTNGLVPRTCYSRLGSFPVVPKAWNPHTFVTRTANTSLSKLGNSCLCVHACPPRPAAVRGTVF